jgi:flavin-dependent dehydrogenase
MSNYDTDVFIVGGGPAGLAAAIAASQKGLSVMVADAAEPPIDKPCGEGLMPDSLEVLRDLGVSLDGLDYGQFRGIRFLDSRASVKASFPSGMGRGIRRTVLHQLLVDRAANAGVNFLWRQRIAGLGLHRVSVYGQKSVRARWIVGADGGQSQVRAWAGLDQHRSNTRRYGFRRHYRIAPWTEYMEIYWAAGVQAYVTPISSSEVCIAVISRDPTLRLQQGLAKLPRLAERLAHAETTTAEGGAVSASLAIRSVYRDEVALIGDASGSVDAITGEGLCLSFRQALALASAMEQGDLAAYQAAHRRLRRRPALMAALMLSLDSHDWLRRSAIPAMAAVPLVFRGLLSVHVGATL